jgi:hypothetical protein
MCYASSNPCIDRYAWTAPNTNAGAHRNQSDASCAANIIAAMHARIASKVLWSLARANDTMHRQHS